MKIRMWTLLAAAAVAALLLVPPAGSQFPGRLKDVMKKAEALKPITTEEEVAMGKEMAAKMIYYCKTFDNEKAAAYVRKVGAVVAAQAERQDVKYNFEILDTDDINAFATAGGYIFVTRALLENIKTESELAGVLGHEVGHVAGKHVVKQLESEKAMQTGLKEASNRTPGSAYFKDIAEKMVERLIDRGLDHKYEYEADERGTGYAYAAGYRPDGLKSFLTTLQPIIAKSEASTAWLSRTHPKTDDRIEKLTQLIAQKKMESEGRSDNFQRYQRTMKDAAK